MSPPPSTSVAYARRTESKLAPPVEKMTGLPVSARRRSSGTLVTSAEATL